MPTAAAFATRQLPGPLAMREVPVDLPDGPASMRIVLVGHMGAGKTSLARSWCVAGSVRPALWFDSDAAACAHLGLPDPATAFSEVGEEGWRSAERAVIIERAPRLEHGIELWSLGAGACQHPDVQRVLMEADVVVWLDAPIELLWQRVQQAGDRPLATDVDSFAELHGDRSSTWEALSTIRLDTGAELDEIQLPRALADRIGVDALCSSLCVGHGLLARMDEVAALHGADVVIVADPVLEQQAGQVAAQLAGRVLRLDLVHAGEWNKQMDTVERLVRGWSAAGVHRETVVVAIGGGTLLDVAGFAASIHQRGLRWVSVPTTVLAQVDAGIGGKTGVNLGSLKNVLGTVHEPDAVLVDPGALASLPDELVAEGWVEAAKTTLLAGGELLELGRRVDARAAVQSPDWARLIAGCGAFKDAVVAEDPADLDGIRAQLNLGHTLAHAIESATVGGVSHGRAVAIGIHAALLISTRELGLDPDVPARWACDCIERGIDVRSPLAFDELEPLLVHDKKRSVDGIGWALLRAPGVPVTGVHVPVDVVRAVWDDHIHDPAARATTWQVQASAPRVLVLFGINLGELGHRDPEHYGAHDLPSLIRSISKWAEGHGIVADCRQTDSLERFVAALHEARSTASAVIVNPGAWTHHELAIHDALEMLDMPRVEVHLSDVGAREQWRQTSVIRPVVDHEVAGAGPDGYRMALAWIAEQLGTGGSVV